MTFLSLESFRGMVQSFPSTDVPVMSAVKVDAGFILQYHAARLKSARGEIRIFKSLDSVFRYVSEHISGPCSRTVELKVLCTGSSQLF